MKNKNPNATDVKSRLLRIGHFFFTHNRMIYFLLFTCVLIGALASLNLVLSQPSDDAYRTSKLTEAQSPRFDQATIEKIKNLNERQQAITDPAPTNQRINPFSE